jgi:hypothetical protein
MNAVASVKQEILCWLVGDGFTILRAIQSSAAHHSLWWISQHRKSFDYGFALANLLHRVHISIAEPDFVENDITFINFAIPRFLGKAGANADPSIVKRLVAFYDAAPEELKTSLEWQPTPAHREIAASVGY